MKRLGKSLLLLFLFGQGYACAAQLDLTALKVEYVEKPLGIDVERPRFSWQMQAKSDAHGVRQTAYALTVRDERGALVWDSGKTSGDSALNLTYAGKALAPATRYRWSVKAWDQDGVAHAASSWFETGLMQTGTGAAGWNGAKWIGGADQDAVLYAHYLPVFKLGYTVQLDRTSNSTRAGFVYGANDARLLDRNKNPGELQSKRNSSYVMLEIDTSGLRTGQDAALNIYRVGYHANDKADVPFKRVAIARSLINPGNQYEQHSISLSSNLGQTRILIDGEGPQHLVTELNLNPLGQGGDHIAFPVVGDIGFQLAKNQNARFSDVQVRHFRSPSNSLFSEDLAHGPYRGIFAAGGAGLAVEDKAYRISGGENGRLIVADPSRNAMPMLRTSFTPAKAGIAKARLYVTARGIYDVYLNGKRVGDDYFNPGMTQYNKSQLYQTYDVSKYLVPGRNALGAVLGEGWWSGAITYMGEFWNFFGDSQSLLAKLVITYTDGKQDIITSQPGSWQYFKQGPVVYGSFFQGEVYDATREALTRNWSTGAYDASAWKPAAEVSLQGHVTNDELNARRNMPSAKDYSSLNLQGQFGPTVRKVKELGAIGVQQVRPGVYVYDMGQNMVGVPRISLSGHAPGTRIALRYAEVTYPHMPEYGDKAGMLMLENIRAAMAQDIYLTRGGREEIAPRFTFHGYRYLEITGIDRPLPLAAVKGQVISSIDRLASSYESSNAQLNKLWQNITWSTYSNFLSIPTDCPQRNERLGWSGDISVFSRTATYMADVPQFLRRHLLSMRDTQRADGRFADVSPLGTGFGGVLWGSAGITLAWESYRQYGDLAMVGEHYDAMKRYVDYILAKNIDPQSGILVQEDPHAWINLGDWLGPEQGKNDNSLLWESQLIFDLQIMQKFAALLGKNADQARFAQVLDQRTRFFNATYFDADGKTRHSSFKQDLAAKYQPGDLVDTQTSYVLPLVFGIASEQNKSRVAANLAATVKRAGTTDSGTATQPYSLMTGFIGTAWISQALSDSGHVDLAYRLLLQSTYPSWLYPVEQGATTVWERLDSYTHVKGFGGNNGMNSFNHYAFGAVGAWMVTHSLGIERDEDTPAFKRFRLKPEPDPTGKLSYAKGHYDSLYGRIESGWTRTAGGTSYAFTVPANTTATVYLPAASQAEVRYTARPGQARHIRFLRMEAGKAVFEVGSGKYAFSTP